MAETKLVSKRKTAIKVEATNDYELFNLVKSNRPINQRHLKRLVNSIKEKNMLKFYPIQVTCEGKVLDGQHRLEAAKKLNLPIYYMIVDESVTIADIAMSNHATKTWTRADYLHHWCERSEQHYIALRDFVSKHDWMSVSVGMAVCSGIASHKRMSDAMQQDFVDGAFRIVDMRFATMFASAINDFRKYVTFATDRFFMAAICILLRKENYDHSRMIHKMEIAGGRLLRSPDIDNYLRQLEEIYNFKARGGYVRFI